MKRLICLLLIALTAVAMAEDDKSWASNGMWDIRLVKVQTVTNLKDYQALPWTDKMTGGVRDKHMTHARRAVFDKEKKVTLLTIELKNKSGGSHKVGANLPYWRVRCQDGQEISSNHSFMQQATTLLEGGMPREEMLAPGKVQRGTLAFYIPDFTDVNILFYRSRGHLSKHFGESESLVLKVNPKKVTGGKAVVGASNSKQPWVSNKLWKMRVTKAREVTSYQDYLKLPWNDRMTGSKRDKHLKYVKGNVYGKEKKLVLLSVELKNLHDTPQKCGVGRPYWFVSLSNGKDQSNNHSFTRQVSFLLTGGLPQETRLNSNDTVRGDIAFFIPAGVSVQSLSYKAQGHIGKSFGKSKSIVLPVP